MALVTAGHMNKQVAWKLGISEAAAKLSRGAMMRKMGATSLADLVRIADQLGIREDQIEQIGLSTVIAAQ
jgi:FixJ family two-component response regulator